MKKDCAHPPCNCHHETSKMVERDDKFYCSDACSQAVGDTGPCPCGHPDCH